MRETLISATHRSLLNLSRLEVAAWCILIALVGVAGALCSLKISSDLVVKNMKKGLTTASHVDESDQPNRKGEALEGDQLK
jgi:hypothetical protein